MTATTGKTINSKANVAVTTTTEGLRSLITQRYNATRYIVPGFANPQLIVELAILKRREREIIVKAVQRADGTWDNLLQNRMCVAYGLINPKILPDVPFEDDNDPAVHEAYVKAVTEELQEYPDAFIDPIAKEIWRISNDDSDIKGGSKANPFPRTSGSPSGSSIGQE